MKTNIHLWSYLAQFFLEWEMFQTHTVEKMVYISCEIIFFLNRAVCEMLWKNTVQLDRPQMALRRMRIACWITMATYTKSEYVILMAFPLQQWSHERVSVLRYTYIACLEFSVGQEPNSGLGRLNVDVSRSQTIRHTHTVGLLRTSDQPIAGAATYTSPNKHKRRTFIPSTGIEPAIAGAYWLQTYGLDGAAPDIRYDNKMTSDAFRDAGHRLYESFLHLHNVTRFHGKKKFNVIWLTSAKKVRLSPAPTFTKLSDARCADLLGRTAPKSGNKCGQ
jgi:hypothetical protein